MSTLPWSHAAKHATPDLMKTAKDISKMQASLLAWYDSCLLYTSPSPRDRG